MPLDAEAGLGLGHIVLDGDPAPPTRKEHSAPNCRPMCVVAKRLDGSKCHLFNVVLGPDHIVLDGDPSAHVYWPNGRPSQFELLILQYFVRSNNIRKYDLRKFCGCLR